MAFFGYADIRKHRYMESLISDIESGKKIKTSLGELIIDTNNKEYKSFKKLIDNGDKLKAETQIKGKPVFFDKKSGAGLLITKIDKAPYSGGGGSGAGAAVTAMAESAVCIVCASLVHLGKVDLTEKGIQNISKVLDLGKQSSLTEIKKIVEWLNQNPDWYDTTERTAQTIIDKVKLTKNHHFHRDSQFMNSIYKQFSENLKPLNKLKLRVGGDKWNPADIWISNRSKFPATKDLTTLNQKILEDFSKDDTVGISLKKLGKNITWSVYNLPKTKKLFVFKNVIKPVSPMSSKDMYIETESGLKIQIRSFNAGDNIQSELKGKHANGGKCGFGATRQIVESVSGEKLYTNQDIKKMSEDEIIGHIHKFYKDMNIVTTLDKIKKEFYAKTFKSPAVQQDFLISKMQSTQIASIIHNSKNRNDIVTGIFGYAHSLGLEGLFEASVYAKIY